ncbi:hypothetical protein BDFB_008373 [Asbolus verrucosus]|uniref:Uncharacterized protein n=1 Tax=Asbolus verrucosus TaxID=1661398 RepID=A0A482W3E9_ASBVE|nr:hypothetical protein BDFB_008373 [Asbolus verrucosus]
MTLSETVCRNFSVHHLNTLNKRSRINKEYYHKKCLEISLIIPVLYLTKLILCGEKDGVIPNFNPCFHQ